ncbi:MAG: GH25 family lysozyme, partial [Deltaproteobacteria bacterium]|nr:GH25 family lysozyme [Deltaproteobacteria bacterium]
MNYFYKFLFPVLLIFIPFLFHSCGGETPEDRLFNQLPFEVKSCITDRNKIVHGIDVSYYQGNIDWNKVAAEGHKFAFIRVSDGLNYIDSKFPQNWSGAKSAG